MLIDITRTIGLDNLTFPGDEPPALLRNADLAHGDAFTHTTMHLSCHTGTHLDAPAHFIPGGKTLDQYGVAQFVLDAIVVDTGNAAAVEEEHVAALGLVPGGAVLFKTRNSDLPRTGVVQDHCPISPAAAQRLVAEGVALVGIDYLSVDPLDSPDNPAHAVLLGAGVLILEEANLRDAPPGRYRMICLPLKLHGTEAAPCRAILLGC